MTPITRGHDIGTQNYFLHFDDSDWLQAVWTNYTKAVGLIEGKVGPSGLMTVAGSRDWPQLGGAGAGIDADGNAQFQEVRSLERPVLRKWLT